MAAFAPIAPMAIGAIGGAMLDSKNPLRGAFLGGITGGVAGAGMSAAGLMSGAGSAAGTAAGELGAAGLGGGLPMGAEIGGLASQYGTALGNTVPGMASASAGQQAAMLAAQDAGLGTVGLQHTMGSFGVPAQQAMIQAAGNMGPMGLVDSYTSGMKNFGIGDLKSALQTYSKANTALNAMTPQPMPRSAPMPAPAPMPEPPSSPAPQSGEGFQPISRFQTGPQSSIRRRNQFGFGMYPGR
jgi:hypothetical protein